MLATGLLFLTTLAGAQEYKVSTDQPDSFSIALVKVLNAAPGKFTTCKGEFIRSGSLSGYEYKLNIPFPGSSMAIVRCRDGDQHVYIEFRGFKGKKERDGGIMDLARKIRKALGEQLYDPYENKDPGELYFYGLSVKDSKGYFSMNMELFGGRSAAGSYLLGPEEEDRSKPQQDFILLKIYGGTPAYNYYINSTDPPDKALHATFTQLIKEAATDFDQLRAQTDSYPQKRKRFDTLRLNSFTVIMNYRGSHYSASLQFRVTEGLPPQEAWQYYQQALQAALGSDYVYQVYKSGAQPAILYYRMEGEDKPRIYLQQEGEDNNPCIGIRIESSFSHPVKRSLDRDDL
jgi:hypothetical protein